MIEEIEREIYDLEEEIQNLKCLRSELKEATIEQQLYNLCEDYEYEIDVDYSNCTFEEIKQDLINDVKIQISILKENLENTEQALEDEKEFEKYGRNENAYYSAMYGIPRN